MSYYSGSCPQKTMNMKLVMDGRSKKLLFAEAGKDVVDFLFSLFALPLGTITNLLKKENMPGSIGCLYGSIECLGNHYFQSGDRLDRKTLLLNPRTTVSALKSTFLFTSDTAKSSEVTYYYLCNKDPCPNFTSYATITDVYKSKCTGSYYGCQGQMTKYVKFTVPEVFVGSEGGFVKDMVVYTIMDDLSTVPMSSVTNILAKLNIKDLSSLEEHTVNVGLKEGLMMVKAAMQSKTVLTDVFLTAVKTEHQSQ